ncbi:MAG: hypothetical protein RL616_1546 [Verrucomicrobiota bacterium]|jgi:hypothetical protein
MKIFFRLGLLAAVAALGCWLWTVLFPSPEKAVLKKVSALAETATFSADASSLTRAGKASSMVSLFANDAEIVLDIAGVVTRTLSGREEIREVTLGGFVNLPSLKAEFLDATAKISADKKSAEVSCTAKLQAGSQKDFGVQELRFRFKLVENNWLITRLETVKTLQ